jgi:hypothetical protein
MPIFIQIKNFLVKIPILKIVTNLILKIKVKNNLLKKFVVE